MRTEYREEEEYDEPRESPRRESVFTLTLTTLASLFVGVLLLCALCFGVGFAMGRLGGSEPLLGRSPAGAPASPQASGRAKPSPFMNSAATPAVSAPAAAPSYPSALEASAAPSHATASRASVGGEELARAPHATTSGSFMVQIAAVANPEDAAVLMSALRKHNYAATAGHVADDNLIHVRIGPFATQNEANALRLRLLSDGYNAIVLP